MNASVEERRQELLDEMLPNNDTCQDQEVLHFDHFKRWYALFKETRRQHRPEGHVMLLMIRLDRLVSEIIREKYPALTDAAGSDFHRMYDMVEPIMLDPSYIDIGDDEEHWSYTDLVYAFVSWEAWYHWYNFNMD